MNDQVAAPSLGKTRVVAHITNGAIYSVLATRKGLKSCLKKYEGDPNKHARMPDLQEFAQMIRAIEVLLPEDPNADSPKLNRRIKIREFCESGENYRDTGHGLVAHQRANSKPSRLVATK